MKMRILEFNLATSSTEEIEDALNSFQTTHDVKWTNTLKVGDRLLILAYYDESGNDV